MKEAGQATAGARVAQPPRIVARLALRMRLDGAPLVPVGRKASPAQLTGTTGAVEVVGGMSASAKLAGLRGPLVRGALLHVGTTSGGAVAKTAGLAAAATRTGVIVAGAAGSGESANASRASVSRANIGRAGAKAGVVVLTGTLLGWRMRQAAGQAVAVGPKRLVQAP